MVTWNACSHQAVINWVNGKHKEIYTKKETEQTSCKGVSEHFWHQTGIKIIGRNINNLRYADDTTLMAESEEELKILFMMVKEESENIGLKLNIQETKIMASCPITSCK